MKKPNDDLALAYIREKGYASYSSIKHVRDKTNPYERSGGNHFDIGTETHARWLEKISKLKLPIVDEVIVKGMVESLEKNKMANILLKGAEVEVKMEQRLNGVPLLAYIDIKQKKFLADLKTYGHTNEAKFIADQDFLQPAIYLALAPEADEFYYIGVSKVHPYKVHTYAVSYDKGRMFAAQKELHTLLKYVKKKLF